MWFVDMIRPDKKSVLVYLTCLYEALHPKDLPANHSQDDNTPNNQQTPSNHAANQTALSDAPANVSAAISPATKVDSKRHITHSTVPTSSIALPNPAHEFTLRTGVDAPDVPHKLARLNDQVCSVYSKIGVVLLLLSLAVANGRKTEQNRLR